MIITTDDELQGILAAGRVVADVRDAMLEAIEPGMTTAELDAIGAQLLDDKGALSAPQVMYDFPGATCISINEEVAHGIPGERVIAKGDIVNVDVSAQLGEFFADTGGTIAVPPSNALQDKLISKTREALAAAVDAARAGAPISGIGKASQRVAKDAGFELIRNLTGHGIGRSLHEPPGDIICYYDRTDRRRLKEGHVLAIEPFLSTATRLVRESGDGWTLVADANNLTAQFEHTVIVQAGKPPIIATLGIGDQ